jgi:hypothetical protein
MEGTQMKETLPFVLLFALLASSALAAGPQPAAVYTFTCNGSQKRGMGPCPNGGRPDSLIQGSDGNFYGAAQLSYEGSQAPEGESTSTGGVVFSLTPTGTLTVLHRFVPGPDKNYANGNFPGLLTEGPDGKLYGYTTFGGIDGCNGECGYGVLYRVDRNGSGFQVVTSFCPDASCGDLRPTPTAMVAGTDGNLYGTIAGNGTPYGSIFKVTPSSGSYETVLNFNFSSGEGLASGLTAAPDGTFYAIALGTIPAFLLHYMPSTGDLTTVALTFPPFDTFLPSGPMSGLTFGSNGNLYGLYDIYATAGTGLFEVEPDGNNLQLFPLYDSVIGASADGLLLASDGNFWMAQYYGSDTYGNIIALSPSDGTLLQTLSPFSKSSSVGGFPVELIQAKDGTLWGSTYQYGTASTGQFADGTVFSLNAGLPAR